MPHLLLIVGLGILGYLMYILICRNKVLNALDSLEAVEKSGVPQALINTISAGEVISGSISTATIDNLTWSKFDEGWIPIPMDIRFNKGDSNITEVHDYRG